MRAANATVDASGNASRCSAGGVGFLIEPGGSTPGNLPVTVRFDDGSSIDIVSARPVYAGKRFQWLSIEGGTPNATYTVTIFEREGEGVGSRFAQRDTQPLSSVANVAGAATPTLATQGFLVLPTYRTFQAYFSGVAASVDIYVRSLSGSWYLAETVAAADAAVIARAIAFGGGRVYFKTTQTLDSLDVETER